MAQTSAGTFQADLDRARELTNQGAATFDSAAAERYMNPFVEQALEPTLRGVREEMQRNIRDAGSQAAMAGAFGGSRGTLLQTEAQRIGSQTFADTLARGRFSAFESAAERFDADRSAAARAAEQFRATGAQQQQQTLQDMQALLTTGGLRRSLQQAGLDFDYQQFIEARDWDVTNLQPLLATLSSVPHSKTTTNTAKTSALANVVGIAATVAGAYFGGPAGAKAGLEVWKGQQAEPVPIQEEPSGGVVTFPYERPGSSISVAPITPTFSGASVPYLPFATYQQAYAA